MERKVVIFDHPLIQHKLSILRDEKTGSKQFRELVSEIAMLMCYESTRDLPLTEVEIKTPITTAKTKKLAGRKMAFVPILRAGLGMVDGVSSEYNINIAHDESVNRDVILVTVEAEGRVSFDKTGDTIRELFKSKLSVTPKITVVPVGTLPRTEKKAKRVIDHRE